MRWRPLDPEVVELRRQVAELEARLLHRRRRELVEVLAVRLGTLQHACLPDLRPADCAAGGDVAAQRKRPVVTCPHCGQRTDLLDNRAAAEWLGVSESTWRSLQAKLDTDGRPYAPRPFLIVGNSPAWTVEQLRDFEAGRKGKGWRLGKGKGARGE